MEKAILKTLSYSDIFDYPLKAYEIHKWLIKQPAHTYQIEEALKRLIKKGKLAQYQDFYFLKSRKALVKKRLEREKQSKSYLLKARVFSQVLKIVPFVKLVGVSGGLAMNNASKADDIDLFIITENNRVFLSRLFAIVSFDAMSVRRKVDMSEKQAAGKICLNLILEESKLSQQEQNVFVAHEVLQMKVLWERDNMYSKYLESNAWVFEYLPNWAVGKVASSKFKVKQSFSLSKSLKKKKPIEKVFGISLNLLEVLAKWFQLKIMQRPKGNERIEEGALYFHPNNYQEQILTKFKKVDL